MIFVRGGSNLHLRLPGVDHDDTRGVMFFLKAAE